MAVNIDDALALVRRVLDTQPAGRVPLAARIQAPDSLSDDYGIVIHSKIDDRTHVVSVAVEDEGMTVDTSVFEMTETAGFRFHQFDGIVIGDMRRSPSPTFEADLRRALDAAADAFEPTPSPGVATHEHATEMVQQSAIAVEAYNSDRSEDEHVSLALNAEPTAEPMDVVSFVRADGDTLPIQVRTHRDGTTLHNVDTGDHVHARDVRRAGSQLSEMIGRYLADVGRPAPAP